MKIYKNLIIALSTCLLLSACAVNHPIGNDRIQDDSRVDFLVSNKATKQQVYLLLGQPSDVLYEPSFKTSKWIYYGGTFGVLHGVAEVTLVQTTMSGHNVTLKKETLIFNESNKLIKRHLEVKTDKFRVWDSGKLLDHVKNDEKPARVKAEMERLGLKFDQQKAGAVSDADYFFVKNRS